MNVLKSLAKLLVAACLVVPLMASAAVDVNTADQAALESVKGLGPAMSGRIIAERAKGKFRDWSDLASRVSGLGDKNTVRLSENGLVLDGKPKAGATVSPSADARSAKPDARGTKPARS